MVTLRSSQVSCRLPGCLRDASVSEQDDVTTRDAASGYNGGYLVADHGF
jgi:hypothetical protein